MRHNGVPHKGWVNVSHSQKSRRNNVVYYQYRSQAVQKHRPFTTVKFIKVTDADFERQMVDRVLYPADFTFVCPTELGDLADNYAEFQKMGVEIYSVSTDTHFTHKAWHDTRTPSKSSSR